MAKQFPEIDATHQKFIEDQHLFFVGTAGTDGRVNISPKGMDSLWVLGPNRIVWMNLTGLSEEQIAESNKVKIFGSAFVFQLIITYCLAMFLAAPEVDLATGALYGFLTGAGWMFPAIAVNALFELRSWKMILITGGYWVVDMTIVGAILGGWK